MHQRLTRIQLSLLSAHQIESNRKRSALETTLRKHDRVAKAEDQRRQQQQPSLLVGSNNGGYNYKAFNLIHGLSFGSGCRCCYDPIGDGGEYELLTDAKRERGDDQLNNNNNNNNNNSSNSGGEGTGDATNQQRNGTTNEQTDGSDSGDSEFDYLLDEDIPSSSEYDMQAQRRAELESMAHHYEVIRFHGYGVHRQMHPKRVFASAGYGSSTDRDRVTVKGSVVHLYDAYSPLSVSLDLCLEDMASRYPGTKFLRGLGVMSLLFAEGDGGDQKWKKGDLPMVVALKEGRVVAFSSGLRDFYNAGGDQHNERVEPRAVEQWLEHAGVLFDTPPQMDAVCRIRPEEEMLLENLMKLNMQGGLINAEAPTRSRVEDMEEQRYDCGVNGCNKSFFHEHVGVKNEAQDGLLVSESQVASSEP